MAPSGVGGRFLSPTRNARKSTSAAAPPAAAPYTARRSVVSSRRSHASSTDSSLTRGRALVVDAMTGALFRGKRGTSRENCQGLCVCSERKTLANAVFFDGVIVTTRSRVRVGGVARGGPYTACPGFRRKFCTKYPAPARKGRQRVHGYLQAGVRVLLGQGTPAALFLCSAPSFGGPPGRPCTIMDAELGL